MSHNRNKLITLLIGNLSNVVVHRVLEKSVKEEILRKYYNKESLHSLHVTKWYREQINPLERPLPGIDAAEIKEEVIKRVKHELQLRISKGYRGIELGTIEPTLDKLLQELKIK